MDKISIDDFKGGNCETNRSKVLFETSGLGQAPSKDFYYLSVVKDSIVWRSWRITLRNDTSLPSETIQPWRTFVDSSEGKRLQEEVKRVFGVDTLNYILALVTRSWMPFLRSDVLVEIILHLDLRDIVQLSQVCRAFHNVCCKDFLWKRLYAKHFGGISPFPQNLGWKKAFVMTWKKETTKGKLVKQQESKIQDMLEENVKIKLVM